MAWEIELNDVPTLARCLRAGGYASDRHAVLGAVTFDPQLLRSIPAHAPVATVHDSVLLQARPEDFERMKSSVKDVLASQKLRARCARRIGFREPTDEEIRDYLLRRAVRYPREAEVVETRIADHRETGRWVRQFAPHLAPPPKPVLCLLPREAHLEPGSCGAQALLRAVDEGWWADETTSKETP